MIKPNGNDEEMINMADQTAQNEKTKSAETEPAKKSPVEELSEIYDADVILAPE